jgi:poly-gamma-glutamate synthesis protein (capsule biosynthesis protein)
MHRITFFLLLLAPVWLAGQAVTGRTSQSIRLLFAGDVMGHGAQIKSAEVVADKLYDYSPCFEYVKPLLDEADLAIANLELTLPGKPPYTGYPQFRSPDELALALREAGFDLLVTANNHSNDAGKSGVIETLNTLDEYNFFHTGTFRTAEEREFHYPLLVYRNDFRLAFLNYTYGTNGIPTAAPTIVNLIDESQIKKDLAAARQYSPDVIIVFMHWGLEYQLIENAEQRALSAKLFDWGADLVIGAHPHVVQPIREVSLSRNGVATTGLVAYSLGNFISNQNKPNTDGGIMLEVTLTRDSDTNTTSMTSYRALPVWRYIEKLPGGKVTYRVLPVESIKNDQISPDRYLPAADREAMTRYADGVQNQLAKAGTAEKQEASPVRR